MFDFFYHIVSSRTRFGISLFSSNDVWFFLSHHVILNLIQDLTFIFSNDVWFFYHFFVFILFIKIITTSSKGKETARSPKPAVSLPLNPSLFGHGLRRCLKNLLTLEVNSHYNKILVILTHILSSSVILNLIQDLTFFTFQTLFDFFSFITSLFLLFYKNYYHFT